MKESDYVNKQNQKDFGQGSVAGTILGLAVPMILAQLINLLYNVVDRIYIGHIEGASALAMTGVGLTLPIVSIISAFANLYGMGGAPLFSMARGEGNPERARKLMGNSFSLLLGTGVVIGLLCYVFRRPVLYLFGASDATYHYADDYLTVYLMGTLFVMISQGMNNFINAQGFGLIGMLTVSIGAALNLVLDPLFIFVLGMGVKGAAIATVLSQGVSTVWALIFLTGKWALIPITRESMKVEWHLAKQIVTLGLSGFIMQITNSVAQIMGNAMLQIWGGDLYVGIMTVINSVREIITLPVRGLTSSAQPVISFNYGARKYDRVKSAIRFSTVACIFFSLLAWVLLFFCPRFFLELFNDDPTLIETGVPAMRLYFGGIFMMALQFAGQSTFTALGCSKQAVFFSMFRKVAIVAPLTVILPQFWGLGTDGVFLAEPVSNFVGGIACYTTMLFVVRCKLAAGAGERSKQHGYK